MHARLTVVCLSVCTQVAELTVPTSWSMNTALYLMRNRGVDPNAQGGVAAAQQAHEPEGEASWHEEI